MIRYIFFISIQAMFLLFSVQVWSHQATGLVSDQNGNVYFVLSGAPHNRIMKIDRYGEVTTFVVDGKLRAPHHLVIDQQGNIYTASDNDGIVWKITPNGEFIKYYSSVQENGEGGIGTWGDPFTLDHAGNIYYIDYPGRSMILKTILEGEVSIFAGGPNGFIDSNSGKAYYSHLHSAAVVFGPDSVLYVTGGKQVIKISKDGTISTFDNLGIPFGRTSGIAFDPNQSIYVADKKNNQILKFSANGGSTIFVGNKEQNKSEKASVHAELFLPTGIVFDPFGTLYIMDNPHGSTRIWKLSLDGYFTQLYP